MGDKFSTALSIGGIPLTITGTGFGTTTSDTVVKVDNVVCTVT